MTKNKKLIIVLIIILVVGLLAAGLLIWSGKGKLWPKTGGQTAGDQNLPAPEFLSDEEKTRLGLAPEQKIQALKRNESGGIMVYKIIKDDSDIVLDPASIGPISPRQKTLDK